MTEGLGAGHEFFKGHGLGNDYLVFREGTEWDVAAAAIRTVCDRWRGVGSDGIIVLLGDEPSPQEPFRLRMFNPDGTEFERSGNGLRIFGTFLATQGWVGQDAFRVHVGGDEVVLRVHGRDTRKHFDVSVQMGVTHHGARAVGLDPASLDADGRLDLGAAGRVAINLVSVGNPHAVVFGDSWDDKLLAKLGPAIALHPGFSAGTNVQLAEVASDTLIHARIWERGVGVTASSGTSACAVASAAVFMGRVPSGEIEIRMPGGSLWATVSDDHSVVLRGPAQAVCSGRLDSEFFSPPPP